MHKKIRIVTGIICFLYFLTPIIIDAIGWQSNNYYVFAFLFLATWPYNSLCVKFPHSHFLCYSGQFIVFLVVWYLIFLLCRAIYEMILEIYLDKKRFKEDIDELD